MILVVEDDKDLREMLCVVLQAEGFSVVGAKNGRDALLRLEGVADPKDVCLVLLDLMMPVMSGYEFLEKHRADARLKSIPVVIMSARADEAGAHSVPFIRKPLDLETLVTVARTHCAPAAAGAG